MSEASAPQLVAKSKKRFLQGSTSSQEFDDYRIKPLARLVYSTPFELAIAFVIMANAIALAVLTFPNIRPATEAAAELVAGSSFEDACAHGLTLDQPALQEWMDYQDNPVSLLDQPLSALLVPVEHACQALAAFPNGYFSCDLGPAQNYALARHFAQAHGYELMGVGASYLGFLRAAPADLHVANAVAKDFCALYNTPDENRQAVISAVVQAIRERTHLWLRYVE